MSDTLVLVLTCPHLAWGGDWEAESVEVRAWERGPELGDGQAAVRRPGGQGQGGQGQGGRQGAGGSPGSQGQGAGRSRQEAQIL